jgi:hypothetical protein
MLVGSRLFGLGRASRLEQVRTCRRLNPQRRLPTGYKLLAVCRRQRGMSAGACHRLNLRGEGLKSEAGRACRTSRSTGTLQRPHASLIAVGLVEHHGTWVQPEDVTG